MEVFFTMRSVSRDSVTNLVYLSCVVMSTNVSSNAYTNVIRFLFFIIFNELFLDFTEDLVIVEGVFDAMKAGMNSVPLLGSTLSIKSKLLKEIVKYDTPVYLALDSDAERKSIEVIKELLRYGLEVHKVDTSGYADVGEMSKETFQQRKQQALLINSNNFLSYQLSRV